MQRYAPTIRQLVHSALVFIASHPRIQNPGIYYPIVGTGEEPQEIKITRWLESGGLVLNNPTPGLACAVYPAHSGRDSRRGGPATSVERTLASALYDTYTLGNKQGGVECATYRLIVELSFQDVSYTGQTFALKYSNSHPDMVAISHAYRTLFHDDERFIPHLADPKDYGIPPEVGAGIFIPSELEIEVNPGELVLREYMELMRLVINDLNVMRPFMTKPGQVTMVDLPTGNPLRRGTDIYFHMGYLVWEISMHVPGGWQDVNFCAPQVQDIQIEQSIVGRAPTIFD